jgi:hypothetical protein
MPYSTYRGLTLEGLYELLEVAGRDMVAAIDSKEDREAAIKAMKKQIEILLEIIAEKKKEKQAA